MSRSHSVRCHHCSVWVGEAEQPVVLMGLFKVARDCETVPLPRLTWRCGACGWTNVFRPARTWRDNIEVKRAD